MGAGTPARRPRSVRRTTTHDCTRPHGLDGPLIVTARGRDLRTDDEGTGVVVDAATLRAEVDFSTGLLRALRADNGDDIVEGLAGRSVLGGFRTAVRSAVASDVASRSVRYQLLDDLPVAVLLSGRVLRVAGRRLGEPGRSLPVDICAGWAAGGSLLAGFTDLGPPLHAGPPASALGHVGDPSAWHDHEPLPSHATRRCRRLDVWWDDGIGRIDCWFRDSHADGAGLETVVHEYAVSAAVDPATNAFTRCDADPGALPYAECPAAAPSAGRVVGQPVGATRRWVLDSLTGPSTCTHLNDTLRSLEDVGALLAVVEQQGRAMERVSPGSQRARRDPPG